MIVAIVPALDEEGSIASVVRGVAPHVDVVVVVDNGSRDGTARRAEEAGARVVHQPERGYGAACLAGIAEARAISATVALFLDADGSDDPSEAPRLLAPVREGVADLALGVREGDAIEPGAMTDAQRFGNWLAPALMRALFRAPYHDLPPFKAIRFDALESLELEDRAHGFTIELMLKAHARGLRTLEVAVRCRARRAGASKVSGTLVGSLRAGTKIIASIGRHALVGSRAAARRR